MSSVFGSTPGAASSSQPSLFANLGATTSNSQPASNIFSSLNSSQTPQTGGLFSNLGTASQATSQPSLSSNLGAQTSAPQPQQGSSIFSNVGPSQAVSQSIFGPAQPDGAATHNPQHREPAPLSDSTTYSAYFTGLLEKNKKRDRLADEGPGFGDVPSLQLGLGDIAKRVRALGGTGNQSSGSKGADSNTHYLLAASGVNPGTTLRDLNALNAQTSTKTSTLPPPDWDPDSHRYVEQLQQQSTLKMISEGISRAQRNFDAYLEENIDINWDVQRRKIYQHFGLVPKGSDKFSDSASYSSPGGKGNFGRSKRSGLGSTVKGDRQDTPSKSIYGRSGMQKSVIGTPGVGLQSTSLFKDVAEKSPQRPNVQDEPYLREKQSRFADKVQRLNEARLRELPYPVLHEFAEVEGQPGRDSLNQLLDAYKALIEIVKETTEATTLTDGGAIQERQYAVDYLETSPQSANAIRTRKMVLDGSRRALEKQFFNQLDSVISKNPREANLGGIPTIINKVRAYIRLRDARKNLIPDGIFLQKLNDDYCYALVFFLIRSGYVKEAAEYVTTNSAAFRSFDRNFVTFITQYASSPSRRLQRQQQDKINADYQQRSRMDKVDPYRMACYKVIGRCELSKRSIENVSQGVEDWIWLQFSLARDVTRTEESANEVYGLEQVRDTIREIGQRHFSKGSEDPGGFGTFFYLQILGGLFEEAVAYLYTYSYIAAVHFAIALDYYGLLRISNDSLSESELLSHSTTNLPQISFGRMIGYYTQDFRTGNSVAAVDYLSLICLNKDLPGELGKSQSLLCHEALRELVLETREFAQLLGDIRSDGMRIKGAIEQRLKLIGIADQETYLRTVTLQAASVADDNGRITDAVLLYHLAEDYDNVIKIINRALSDAVAVDIGEEPPRLQSLKPRTGLEQNQPDNGSLSLTSVDDPTVLAMNMISLYNANALYYQKIRPQNREACGVLLRISEAKAKVEAGAWAEALDIISSLHILPLNANNSIPAIRSAAQTVPTLAPTILRLVGPLLLWTITCISRQREALSVDGSHGGFETDTRRAMREELVGKARDLMVFAGLIRLRLAKGVWDGIVNGAGEVGVY